MTSAGLEPDGSLVLASQESHQGADTSTMDPALPLRRARLRLIAAVLGCLLISAVPAGVLATNPAATWALGIVAVMAFVSFVSLSIAAARNSGQIRRGWSLLAAAGVVTILVQLLHLVPTLRGSVLAQSLNWLIVLLAASAALSMPGAKRTTKGWLLLILDGWLVGGSVFVALCIWGQFAGRGFLISAPPALAHGSSAATPGSSLQNSPTATWLLFDLVLACVVFGLTRQVPRDRRTASIALSIGTAALAGSDLFRSFLDESGSDRMAAGYLVCWVMVCGMTAVSPWLGVNDPYAGSATDLITRAGQRAVRVPYVVAFLAIMLGVVGLAMQAVYDPVLLITVLVLLAAIMISQVLLATENGRLYRHVFTQAEEFRERATRDGLTGLPNRYLFNAMVQTALDGPHRGQTAVLFIDLDGFKDVNDSLGHVLGDELLVESAERLQLVMRSRDVVARFGGDEFVALLSDCTEEQSNAIAERVRQTLARPYLLGGREVVVSASIGLARPVATDAADDALRNADLALYSAKQAGRDRVAIYEPEMHVSALRKLDGAGRLREALAADQLSLAFQPVVQMQTGVITGFEALLRFDLADLPGWSVSEAIAIAEETGLVVPIGRWVIDAALRTAGKWVALGHRVGININVSPRQLDEGDLFEIVRTAMLRHRVPPELVTLEITEHQLVSDLDSSTRELVRLRSLGVGVALDDFGTGYSSLSYLTRLPLTALKIDRALVQRVGSARDTIPAVLLLGRDLGLTVIAEGVETREQFVLLRDLGCELTQGFLAGVPVNEALAIRLAAVGWMPVAELLGSFGPTQEQLTSVAVTAAAVSVAVVSAAAASVAVAGTSDESSKDIREHADQPAEKHASELAKQRVELPMETRDPVAR